LKHTLILAAIALCSQAHAINRCTGPDGSVVFQDAPCTGKGETITPKPAAGNAPARPAATPGEKPQTEAQRIEANIAKSQRERRLRDLQEREFPRAQAAVAAHASACRAEQQRLEDQKYRYVQNLYGKTDAAQTASEQAAAASRCDLKDRELREVADRLKKECSELGGCM